MCEDFGTSSFLMGAISGMVASWAIVIYLAVLKKEDNQ